MLATGSTETDRQPLTLQLLMRRARPADARGLLTAYLVLLFLVPAVLVVGPLGAAGSPAALLGVGCLVWWALSRLLPGGSVARGPQPVRVGLAIFVGSALLSYMWGTANGLSTNALNGADRGLLTIAGWSGVALVAADQLRSRQSVEKLLKRLVVLGAVIAGIGFVQSTLRLDVVSMVQIPGLSVNGALRGIIHDDGPLGRVAATASHPIEYGMVLAVILPFALHLALHEKRHRGWWWVSCALIAAVIPMSISRSAMLALAVEFVVLFVTWTPLRRLVAIIVAPIFVVAMRIMSPGLVGTLFNQFANAGNDPSLQGRADSRNAVGHLIDQSPWIGRGFNTYIPADYVKLGLTGVNHGALDNQYLGSIVEVGYLGLVALLALLLVGVGAARGIRLRGGDDATRDLGQCFLAAFLAVGLGMATFDGLGFPMFAGLFFLLLGVAGALWRITRSEWNAIRVAETLTPRAVVGVRGVS